MIVWLDFGFLRLYVDILLENYKESGKYIILRFPSSSFSIVSHLPNTHI